LCSIDVSPGAPDEWLEDTTDPACGMAQTTPLALSSSGSE
jgi:hypothetical protein